MLSAHDANLLCHSFNLMTLPDGDDALQTITTHKFTVIVINLWVVILFLQKNKEILIESIGISFTTICTITMKVFHCLPEKEL